MAYERLRTRVLGSRSYDDGTSRSLALLIAEGMLAWIVASAARPRWTASFHSASHPATVAPTSTVSNHGELVNILASMVLHRQFKEIRS